MTDQGPIALVLHASATILRIAAASVLLGVVAMWILAWQRRMQPRRYAVFVRAPAQTVWDAYFMHVCRAEYRPGRRILNIETLSQSPLTIRATIQMDYVSAPSVITYSFPIHQPPHRYRLEQAGPTGLAEEGTLQEQDGGTLLRVSVQSPLTRPLVAWLAGKRVRQNMRALAIYCEGGTPPPQRPPIRWTWWEAPLALAALLLMAFGAPLQLSLPLLSLAAAVGIWRGWQLARRFFAP